MQELSEPLLDRRESDNPVCPLKLNEDIRAEPTNPDAPVTSIFIGQIRGLGYVNSLLNQRELSLSLHKPKPNAGKPVELRLLEQEWTNGVGGGCKALMGR